VAEEKGFFEDEGLNVKVVVFPDRKSRYNAFMAGNTHFSTGLAGDYALLAAEGYPITIVMEIGVDNSGLIAIKDKFKDLGELKGKTVAYETGTMDQFFLKKALERYGLSIDDVTLVDMSSMESMIAFGMGNVDATVAWASWLTKSIPGIEKKAKAKVAITSEDIPGIFIDCFSVQNEILEHNPDIVVKVLRCYFKGLRWGEEHIDEYYKIANERLFCELSQVKDFVEIAGYIIGQPSLVQQALTSVAEKQHSVSKVFKPEEINEEMREGGPLYQLCQEVLNFYYDQGMIDSKPDPASFVDNELYLKAIEAYYE
jgi:NitT/TauT family transport system substrate-binding protein